MNYQISPVDYRSEPRFSLRYIPAGLADIFFMPPRPGLDFPYFYPDPPHNSIFSPRPLSSQYAGILFILPILGYGFLWPSLLRPTRLRWFAALATVSGLLALFLVAGYFALSYRYFLDFFLPFFLITTLTLLAYERRSLTTFYSRCLFGILMATSLWFGFAFSLTGEFNGIHNFHTYPPPAAGELWLPDGEKTPPRD